MSNQGAGGVFLTADEVRAAQMKNFDVEATQELAVIFRREMSGNYYRHYKGGLYYVNDVVVDEESGRLRVEYRSMDKRTASGEWYKWSRFLDVFTEHVSVDDEMIPRFKKVET
jgi:hypothetical protein